MKLVDRLVMVFAERLKLANWGVFSEEEWVVLGAAGFARELTGANGSVNGIESLETKTKKFKILYPGD